MPLESAIFTQPFDFSLPLIPKFRKECHIRRDVSSSFVVWSTSCPRKKKGGKEVLVPTSISIINNQMSKKKLEIEQEASVARKRRDCYNSLCMLLQWKLWINNRRNILSNRSKKLNPRLSRYGRVLISIINESKTVGLVDDFAIVHVALLLNLNLYISSFTSMKLPFIHGW